MVELPNIDLKTLNMEQIRVLARDIPIIHNALSLEHRGLLSREEALILMVLALAQENRHQEKIINELHVRSMLSAIDAEQIMDRVVWLDQQDDSSASVDLVTAWQLATDRWPTISPYAGIVIKRFDTTMLMPVESGEKYPLPSGVDAIIAGVNAYVRGRYLLAYDERANKLYVGLAEWYGLDDKMKQEEA